MSRRELQTGSLMGLGLARPEFSGIAYAKLRLLTKQERSRLYFISMGQLCVPGTVREGNIPPEKVVNAD